ncbi:MAG: response regulator [Proteobacteria bacterium]|nr:response regulator [Pseudomonadota bacterium]
MANILIVDDSNSMRQMVSFTLKQAGGHTLTESGDGQQGLQAVSRQQFDLIITDMNMPIMNGMEFAKEVRARADYKFTPILVLTTESSAEIKQQGREVGVTGWIVKPFNPDQLAAVVKKVLG